MHSITSRDNSQTTKQPVRAKTKQCGKSAEINAKSLVHERHGDSPPSHQQRLAAPACHVTADHSPVQRMDQQEYQRSLLQNVCYERLHTTPLQPRQNTTGMRYLGTGDCIPPQVQATAPGRICARCYIFTMQEGMNRNVRVAVTVIRRRVSSCSIC